MGFVLPDMRSRDIESFLLAAPDAFNSFSSTGDPAVSDPAEGDWGPTFLRAMTMAIGLDPDFPKQRTKPVTILVGRTRDLYRIRTHIPVFASIIGLYPWVELRFGGTAATDGLVTHYPDTPSGLGTYHPGNGYALAPGMEPWEGYGSPSTLRISNILVRILDNTGPNCRGIVCHIRARIDDCIVIGAKWHGFHVRGDVTAGYKSNASGTIIDNCAADICGQTWGTRADLVHPTINPDGSRGFGWGLKLNGGDANLCRINSFDATSCQRGGVHHFGFLDGTIIGLHSEQVTLGAVRTADEDARAASSLAWLNANPPGGTLALADPAEWARLSAIASETYHAHRTWPGPDGNDRLAGTTNLWAHVLDGESARVTAIGTYAESPGIGFNSGSNIAVGGIMTGSGRGMKVGVNTNMITGEWRTARRPDVYPRLSFGASDTIPLTLDGPLASQFLTQLGPWIAWAYQGLAGRVASQICLEAATIDGRQIERGRIVIPQAFYLGSTRVSVATSDPATTPPSSSGAWWTHGNGPGDQPGDLAFWPAGPKTSGSTVLWICRDDSGTLSWQPLLTMP